MFGDETEQDSADLLVLLQAAQRPAPTPADRSSVIWALNDAGMEGPDRLKYANALLAKFEVTVR